MSTRNKISHITLPLPLPLPSPLLPHPLPLLHPSPPPHPPTLPSSTLLSPSHSPFFPQTSHLSFPSRARVYNDIHDNGCGPARPEGLQECRMQLLR